MPDEKRPVVPWLPWTWAPPAVVAGKIADKLGLPNSPEGQPGLPVPVRCALKLRQLLGK